jgi:hypothetical protein
MYERNALIEKSLVKYKDILDKIYRDFEGQLNVILTETLTTQERDDKLHYLNISFRNEIESKRNEFHEKLAKNIKDDDSFTLSIQIHKEFIQYCDRFAALYEPHMSFNPNDSSDPRNMIRICPYCRLIWFKTEGCDGETCCGQIGQKFDVQDTKAYQFVKYVFQYVEGKLECIENLIPENTTFIEVSKNDHDQLRMSPHDLGIQII